MTEDRESGAVFNEVQKGPVLLAEPATGEQVQRVEKAEEFGHLYAKGHEDSPRAGQNHPQKFQEPEELLENGFIVQQQSTRNHKKYYLIYNSRILKIQRDPLRSAHLKQISPRQKSRNSFYQRF